MTDTTPKWQAQGYSSLQEWLMSGYANYGKAAPEQPPPVGHIDPLPPLTNGHDEQPLEAICPTILEGLPVPEREWIIEGVIPAANVTMLAGDGGIGKSLLAQQLMTSAATGRQWLGMGVLRCKTLGVFCEDDIYELHARQEAINTSLNCNYTDLGEVTWIPRVGTSNGMVSFGFDGAATRTEFYHAIHAEVDRQGAQLVILDSLHDLFIGDENRRGQAREFIGALRALIQPQRGAILLCSHPSLSGMQSGTGTAGNTGWNNAVRARHYLTRPDGDNADPNIRVFKTMKSNYGPAGQNIELEWKDGVFVRTDMQGTMGAIEKRSAESVFMLLLDQLTEQGRPVSDNRRASNYAPAIFMDMPARGGVRRRDLELAMEVLFAQKRIGRISYGPRSDHTAKLYRLRPDVEIEDEAE